VDAIREGRRIGANIVKFVCHLMAGKYRQGGREGGKEGEREGEREDGEGILALTSQSS